jgi:hypothetical protein
MKDHIAKLLDPERALLRFIRMSDHLCSELAWTAIGMRLYACANYHTTLNVADMIILRSSARQALEYAERTKLAGTSTAVYN